STVLYVSFAYLLRRFLPKLVLFVTLFFKRPSLSKLNISVRYGWQLLSTILRTVLIILCSRRSFRVCSPNLFKRGSAWASLCSPQIILLAIFCTVSNFVRLVFEELTKVRLQYSR